jgi:hypothetical protein
MAFELIRSNSVTAVAGVNPLEAFTEVRPMSVTVYLNALDGCDIQVTAETQSAGGDYGNVWRSEVITVAAYAAGAAGPTFDAVVVPPFPVGRWGGVALNVISGTPSGPVHWDVFGL